MLVPWVQGGCGGYQGSSRGRGVVSMRGVMNSLWPRKRGAEPVAEGEGQLQGRASAP